MVASTHWLASAAGMAVLEQGGNAFDAAVAAGFTLQVVEPHLNGPGGDLPALLWRSGDEPIVLCAQGPAPRAATIGRYRDELGLDLVPGTGPLSAVVPGSFGGWLTMLRDYGTLPLADVLRFAIGYAEDGYPMLPQIAGAIRNVESLFRDEWTTSAAVYLPLPESGTLHRNPQLAATYRRILAESKGDIDAALDCWYRGFVAEEFVRFQAEEWMDSSGERHSGLLVEEDLRDWRPTYEQPLAVDYHGFSALKAGPWSQAPVFLQQLRLLEGFDLAGMGHASAEYVHTVTECAKLAFADREAWYGDPDFVDVPMELLLSREYADERRALVGDEASAELRPGGPDPRLPAPVHGAPVAPGVGEPTRGDTVHLDVVDRFGNMVAATPSGGWLWGAPVIPELGFCLGTRAQMFWLEEGLPNSLEPGKRPRTTLSPTLVARDGEPYLALGTPGGDQQDQWTLNTFLAHVHFDLNLQEAIDAPGHHTEAFPSSFYPRETRVRHVAVEDRAGAETIDGLRERGHDVEVSGPWSLGRVSAVGRERDGQLKAAANPRSMQGYAAGR
ncbi:MAG: gamma-glutamyltranspeptidase / glutathione hydrolase [Gaiellaceae bacterium]|jgi:gamma-glutamyltranspeptidase/glutathione hydrolase|nr:gamma-glutamyltranspeptidase / glutathione hydrolase [Gaiellaceae bacterium]MDX6441006.1 gamma-glutamyltranspeptidase / glutathione hydrolase [Gaiellaceae bacterium]